MTKDTKLAVDLMRQAYELGALLERVQDLIRTPGHPIKEEKTAIDNFWKSQVDISSAMRTIAMRLDRSAMAQYEVENDCQHEFVSIASPPILSNRRVCEKCGQISY